MTFRYVDCHGLAGPMACGAVQAGMTLVGKRETEPFGIVPMEANRVFLGDAWEYQMDSPARWEPVETDIIGATVPCLVKITGGVDANNTERMHSIFRYAARVKPLAVVMETFINVLNSDYPLVKSLMKGLREETGIHYHCTHLLLNAIHTGSCLNQRRYFLVMTQAPFSVAIERPGEKPTFGGVVGDLRSLPFAWEDQDLAEEPPWDGVLRRPDNRVDGHMIEYSAMTDRIRSLTTGPTATDWMPGEKLTDLLKRHYWQNGELPDAWRSRQDRLVSTNFSIPTSDQVKAWAWDHPPLGLNMFGTVLTWHPDGRMLTYREAARVMGYPDAWLIEPLRNDPNVARYWGRGPSVTMARWVFHWVRECLEGRPGPLHGAYRGDGDDQILDVSKAIRSAELRGA
jgi:site-specific DNA-cytosine methylase